MSTSDSPSMAGVELQAHAGGIDPGAVWLHMLSSSVIAAAFVAITAILVWALRYRADASFRRTLMLFGGLIFCSGATFVIGVLNIWDAQQWTESVLKALAAAVALGAAITIYRVAPMIARSPGPADFARINRDLEGRVHERTAELEDANARLRNEVAERERAESEVRNLNARLSERVEELEALFRVLPVAVALAEDQACMRVRGNPAMDRLLRTGPDRNMSLTPGAPDAPTHFQVWRRGRCLLSEELPMQTVGREGCELRDFEETIVHADGTRCEVIADVVPLRRADGVVRGVVGVFRDLTELKRTTEERLIFERRVLETQKTQSIGRLAAGVAHDFNNLLAVIKGAMDLARGENGMPENAVRRLDTADFAVRRASDLCEQMLSYAGQGRLTKQHVDVNESVQKSVNLVRSSFPRGRDVVLELDGNTGSIEADPSQVTQVVVNLLTNALEASEQTGAPVRISTGVVEVDEEDLRAIQPADSLAPGRCAFICVKDVGLGMDALTLRQLFTPFFSTKFQGRGLGLAAVLGVARSHRGGVRVWSQPNRGTRVEVFFPIGPRNNGEGTRIPPPVVSKNWVQRPRRVLVVDDEAMIRRVVASFLESRGFAVETAGGGREALEMLDSAEYGLIVLDAAMPDLDGLETMRRFKPVRPQLAVIIISGSAQEEIVERFRTLEPDAILHKPFEFSELEEVLGRIYENRASES
ncbi:MAG: hybrid sensor histidine kinase/response regulator [Opitutaceae bacterium]